MRIDGRYGRTLGLFALGLCVLCSTAERAAGQGTAWEPRLAAPAPKPDQAQHKPLMFVQNAFPDAVIGVPYASSVQAIGGTGVHDLTISGNLPPGMGAETGSSTMAVSGVPTGTGKFDFEVTVLDLDGSVLHGSYSILVKAPVPFAGPLNAVVTDDEAFTLSDTENVFFPAQISVIENFSVADTEFDLTAPEILDQETLSFSDAVTISVLTVPTLSWTAPAPISYGTPVSAAWLNATSSVPGTFSYSPAAGTVLPAGSQILSVTFTPTDTATYATATQTVTLVVSPAPLTVTVANASRLYGQPNPAFSASIGGFVNGDPASVVTGTPSLTTTATAASPAGSYPITASLGSLSAANYSFTFVNGTLTVGVASPALSISASAPSIFTTQSVTLTLAVNGGSGNATPSGSVVVAGGGYSSSALTLAGGTAQVTIPAGALTAGPDTLVATYTPDLASAVYYSGTTAATVVTVSAPKAAALTAPSASLLPGSTVGFAWSAGSGVTLYQLLVGTTGVGSSNIYGGPYTAALGATLTNVPTGGGTLYVRLRSFSYGAWLFTDYTFAESGVASPAILSSPASGSTLGGSSATFTWTAGSGVSLYQLLIGTTGAGSWNVYGGPYTAATSVPVSGIPTGGGTLYVRVRSYINGAWQVSDSTLIESGVPIPAVLSAPATGSTLGGSSATFTWTAGSGVSLYQLLIGTTGAGSWNVYGGPYTAATSVPVSGIPTGGGTLYVRVRSYIKGAWQVSDSTLLEAGTAAKASLVFPAPGTLTPIGGSVAFQWNAGSGVALYQLLVGTTGAGSSNLYAGGYVTTLAATVNSLPVGSKVYVRLRSFINGAWQSTDYVFTA